MISTSQTPAQGVVVPSDVAFLVTPGALVIDVNSKILYSSNGSASFVIGANSVDTKITNTVSVGNSSVNVVINSTAISLSGSPFAVGFTGSRGFTGSVGGVGFTGSGGTNGSTGFTGSGGTTGFTGSASGPTGFTGSPGVGFTGSAGIPGGYTGSAGYQGNQGNPGYTGSPGTGGVGPQGYTGSGFVVGSNTEVYFNDQGTTNSNPNFTFSNNVMTVNVASFQNINWIPIIPDVTPANGVMWFDGAALRLVVNNNIMTLQMV